MLDNCEHLIGGCAKVADAILRRCPRVHLLVTSREPLGIGGESIYRVPPMSLPGPGDPHSSSPGSSDAVALFADRARAQGVALNIDEQTGPLVVSICRRLDGMPLAIELAAARLRSLSLSELSDRLDQRFRLLTGGSRTALERQQTLRATVGWSYSLLTDAERVLLARLSVFAESFDLDAAETVCGFGSIDVLEVADLLGSLVDKSLVVAEPSATALRYRLLETIRLFAGEQLAEAGDDEALAVAAAHCAYFLAVAETAAGHLTGPNQGSWLARLDVDQANLRRAAGHAAGRPDGTPLVLRLGVALERYWTTRFRTQEAFDLLVPALSRPDARADPGLFATALVTATIAAQQIDEATSRQLAEQAVQAARQLGDDRLLILALGALCAAYNLAGDPKAALRIGQETVERARRLGDDVLLGVSLMLYLQTIDPARSLHLAGEAIACTERSGDHFINHILHDNAGRAALITGDIPAARAHLQAAAQAAQQIGQDTAWLASLAGQVLRAEGDPDGARSRFEAGLRISRRNGDNRSMAEAILGLACLAGDAGDWDRAAALHGAAQAFLDRTGFPWGESDVRYRQDSLDQAHAHLGDEQLKRAYAQGTALSPEKALDLAQVVAALGSQDTAAGQARAAASDEAASVLTPRELDVLKLVAQGLSNPDIAQRLFLSEHTVHRHLANILRKLGLSSRAAAAAWGAAPGWCEPGPIGPSAAAAYGRCGSPGRSRYSPWRMNTSIRPTAAQVTSMATSPGPGGIGQLCQPQYLRRAEAGHLDCLHRSSCDARLVRCWPDAERA